jgi:ribosomal protein S18 acetylase RimI-like enzyme
VVAQFTIRPAVASDQSFITEMQYAAFFVPPGGAPFPRSILDDPAIVKYHRDFGSRPGDVGVVALDDAGRRLGAAWVRLVEGYGFVDRETPELGIAVVDGVRGQGIGTALLEELLARVPRCSLSVDRRNPAMRLYERLGFEAVTDDGDAVTMLRGRA